MAETEVADVLLSSATDGDVRVNLGEASNDLGFGADTSVWGSDGFLGVPNPQTDTGAAQVIYIQDGHVRRAIAARDNRYANKAGPLAPGDRAVVSNSEAWLKLTAATNTIEIRSGDMVVKLDGDLGRITVERPEGRISLDADELIAEYGTSKITASAASVRVEHPSLIPPGLAVLTVSALGVVVGEGVTPPVGVLYGTAATPLTSTKLFVYPG